MLMKTGSLMRRRIQAHIRGNIVAYLALFLSLGGTSVAAVGLANHSIDPVKLNSRNIGGYVRAWVSINTNGRLTASGGKKALIHDESYVTPGHYLIDWKQRPSGRCAALGTVDLNGGSGQSAPGYVNADAFNTRTRGEQSFVQVYGAQGQPAALAYDLELICATPR